MGALEILIAQLEQDRSLDEPNRLRQRIEALDRLEIYLTPEPVHASEPEPAIGAGLRDRAIALSARLDAVNDKLYQTIRREIQRGAGVDSLLEWARESASVGDDCAAPRMHGEGYDHLDALVSGVLQFDEPAADVAALAAEMVFYQPTPARHIFDLIGRAALSERDVLIDLGSGLGHVPLLASLCTGVRSIGIEREAAYVACARRSARSLNLADATFVEQDARDADLSGGTLFYLYTPFTGTILRSVLDSLRREAASREIRIGTFGPCTSIVAAEPWLDVIGTLEADRTALFRSRS